VTNQKKERVRGCCVVPAVGSDRKNGVKKQLASFQTSFPAYGLVDFCHDCKESAADSQHELSDVKHKTETTEDCLFWGLFPVGRFLRQWFVHTPFASPHTYRTEETEKYYEELAKPLVNHYCACAPMTSRSRTVLGASTFRIRACIISIIWNNVLKVSPVPPS